jgi:mitofusin 2
MAQAYYSSTGQTASPLPTKESSFEGLSGSEKLLKVEDVQEAYIEHKDWSVG